MIPPELSSPEMARTAAQFARPHKYIHASIYCLQVPGTGVCLYRAMRMRQAQTHPRAVVFLYGDLYGNGCRGAKTQVMELDPFWRPQTNEEREDEGEEGHLSVSNIARQYLDRIRRRKGLASNEKIVVAAEKQRTLTRNK